MFTYRLRTSDDQPIVGAALRGDDDRRASRPQTRTSDRFGRLFRFLRFGESINASVEKPGFVTQHLAAICSPGNPRDDDIAVRMPAGPLR